MRCMHVEANNVASGRKMNCVLSSIHISKNARVAMRGVVGCGTAR
jgi:hypothetical protein